MVLTCSDSSHGIVLFGGYDKSKYSPPLTTLPMQASAGSGNYQAYFVVLDGMTGGPEGQDYDIKFPVTESISVMLDSGCPNMVIYRDAPRSNADVSCTATSRIHCHTHTGLRGRILHGWYQLPFDTLLPINSRLHHQVWSRWATRSRHRSCNERIGDHPLRQ